MQILVEGLRRTIAARVAHAKANILDGAVSHIGTRREDDIIHHIVLVQSTTNNEVELVAAPLVLYVETCGLYRLLDVAVEADRVVVKVVVCVLKSCRKLCRHKKALVDDVAILQARNEGQILGLAVCVGVLACAVIAVTRDGLRRGVNIEQMARVGREVVPAQAAAVDLVAYLLGNLGHMGRLVDVVATTTMLADVMVLG